MTPASLQRSVPLVATVVSGLGLSLFVKPPLLWLFGASLLALVGLGVDRVVRFSMGSGTRARAASSALWILPCLVAAAIFAWLQQPVFSSALGAGSLLATAAALLMAILVLQSRVAVADERYYHASRIGLDLIAYLAAFGLYTLIYTTKIRSMFTATAVLLVSFLVTIELLKGSGETARRNIMYAGVVGLLMGEATWTLNYWMVNAFMGGALLVLVHYFVVGVIQNHLAGRLSRPLLLEYGLLVLLGFALALLSISG